MRLSVSVACFIYILTTLNSSITYGTMVMIVLGIILSLFLDIKELTK